MTDKVGGSHILGICQSLLNSDLGLAGNEVLFLPGGRVPPGFSSTTTRDMFQTSPEELSSTHMLGILKGIQKSQKTFHQGHRATSPLLVQL
jgi:hypothetical protein